MGQLPKRVYPESVDEILRTWRHHELGSLARKLRLVLCRPNGALIQISEECELINIYIM
jgi:hypothetical protein